MQDEERQRRRVDEIEGRFARRMREHRAEAGLSQEDLAARAVDAGAPMIQTTIAKIENGSRAIRLGEAVVLADALGTDIYKLLEFQLTEIADELSRAEARVLATRSREAAARRASEEAEEAEKAASAAAKLARSRLEDVWSEQRAAMEVYEQLLKTRKAPRHG